MIHKWLSSLSYTRTIALGFLGVILLGSLLLCLPISSRSGEWTPFLNTLFTATSATCVTGLVVYDTYTYWSVFGQCVILLMIQIGGIGFMTIITTFAIFRKKKIGLHERLLLKASAGNTRIGGMVKLAKQIIKGTLIFEGIGALLLAIRFVPGLGWISGIYYAIFHSISSFCNAGFDLMGRYERFSSLTGYETDVLINAVVMLLIIIGGIGFLVWADIIKYRGRFREFSLHSKIVLIVTAFLIILGGIGFLIFESKGNLHGMNTGERLLSSMFMSVTTRTAGYNTMDLGKLSESGSLLAMVLMFIGGSPGSTAGGIKTTTFAVVLFSVISISRGNSEITVSKRRIEPNIVKQAISIMAVYLTGILTATMIICFLEPFSMREVLFETISAAGTVGLTQGITTSLGGISKIILIILMYGGRIGGLSLLLVFAEKKKEAPIKRPSEQILLG
ncbi:MAG: Trk family potassium uptake protein [Lachnospiraceae bacterium]|nr:Trk family potassium uptake protein [Lachnospiraceae bacterium]